MDLRLRLALDAADLELVSTDPELAAVALAMAVENLLGVRIPDEDIVLERLLDVQYLQALLAAGGR